MSRARAETMATQRKPKSEPFRHTPRELAVLNRAHADMMSRFSSGQHYDVVRRAWVDADGNVVRDDAAWLAKRA